MDTPPPPPFEPAPFGAPAPAAAAPRGPRPSNTMILAIVTLASLLLVVGLVVLQSRALIAPPSSQDFPNSAEYLAAQRVYESTMRTLGFVGVLLMDLAVGFVLLAGFAIAVGRADFPDILRRSALAMGIGLAAVWIIIFFLLGGFVLGGP